MKDFCGYVTDNAEPKNHIISANEGMHFKLILRNGSSNCDRALFVNEQNSLRLLAKLRTGKHHQPDNVAGPPTSLRDSDAAADRMERRAGKKRRASTHGFHLILILRSKEKR